MMSKSRTDRPASEPVDPSVMTRDEDGDAPFSALRRWFTRVRLLGSHLTRSLPGLLGIAHHPGS